MTNKRPKSWRRLDNAAKIFPSTSEGSDTRVFRFSCQLKEVIDPALLQHAFDETLERFPSFSAVIRKGFFWYYLEQRDLAIQIEKETAPPCSRIYENGRKEPLLRVSYYRERINFEVFHSLTDGTGAMQFLKVLVCSYLNLAHPDVFDKDSSVDALTAPIDAQSTDGFQKYYRKNAKNAKLKIAHAYLHKGEPREDGTIQALEGAVSVREVLEAAHRHNTTLTVYLTSIMIEAFHRCMYLREEQKPVVISLPINLRNYFPSETAQNFFGMMSVSYDFSKQPTDFASIVQSVHQSFLAMLQKDALTERMNQLAALEHNPVIRLAPLPFKNMALRSSRYFSDLGTTTVISNIGRVQMPEQYIPYVDHFSILTSTLRAQLCACSFGDKLQLGFTCALTNVEPLRNFFHLLAEDGIAITLNCNDYEEGSHATLSEL